MTDQEVYHLKVALFTGSETTRFLLKSRNNYDLLKTIANKGCLQVSNSTVALAISHCKHYNQQRLKWNWNKFKIRKKRLDQKSVRLTGHPSHPDGTRSYSILSFWWIMVRISVCILAPIYALDFLLTTKIRPEKCPPNWSSIAPIWYPSVLNLIFLVNYGKNIRVYIGTHLCLGLPLDNKWRYTIFYIIHSDNSQQSLSVNKTFDDWKVTFNTTAGALWAGWIYFIWLAIKQTHWVLLSVKATQKVT